MNEPAAPVDANVTSTPSSSPEPTAAPSTPASTGETPAPSPSATPASPQESQGETRESLLEFVQKAVPELRTSQDESAAEGASPAPAAKSESATSPDGAPAAEEELPDEPPPEELAQLAPTSKRRVKKLLDQRRELRADLDRLKGLEPQAKAAESVTKYLQENDIGQDDFLLTLELAAAMRRGDFRTFYEGVRPYMQLAEEYLGVALPQDLQQRVAEGHMTTQAARMFARERMDRALAESQRVRQAQKYDQTTTVQTQTTLANNVANKVNEWEQATMAADPDYARKQAAVQDTMWAVVREKGRPQSPEHAVAIAQEAYRRVNERYRSWVPPARPTSRQPSSMGNKANGAAPEAKTLLDAVRIARETARV